MIGPAVTVQGALEVLAQTHPDACVLDVNLRGEHSAPVAAALKAHQVPFVLSSAYDRINFEKIPEFAGSDNLGKPVSEKALLSSLALLLGA